MRDDSRLSERRNALAGRKRIPQKAVLVVPVKEYTADDVRQIRGKTGLSQRIFAQYLGVSNKTVEAWETGVNHPSGAASRLLHMLEVNPDLIFEYPFVRINLDQMGRAQNI